MQRKLASFFLQDTLNLESDALATEVISLGMKNQFVEKVKMKANEAFLAQLIKSQYKIANDMLLYSLIHLVLAVGVFFTLPNFLPVGLQKELLTLLGTGLIGTLGFNPYKESLDRREKAGKLEALLPLVNSIEQDPASVDQSEKQRIEELFLKLVEKTALG